MVSTLTWPEEVCTMRSCAPARSGMAIRTANAKKLHLFMTRSRRSACAEIVARIASSVSPQRLNGGEAVLLLGQRIRTELKVDSNRPAALAPFPQPGCPVAAGGPQPAALPAGMRVIDAPIKPLGVEAQRVWHPQRDHPAVLERDQAVHEVGGGHRHILAQPECVVLVNPGVVARLGAVLPDALEARAGVL